MPPAGDRRPDVQPTCLIPIQCNSGQFRDGCGFATEEVELAAATLRDWWARSFALYPHIIPQTSGEREKAMDTTTISLIVAALVGVLYMQRRRARLSREED